MVLDRGRREHWRILLLLGSELLRQPLQGVREELDQPGQALLARPKMFRTGSDVLS